MGQTVNRKCRKFHDPWGNKNGNRFGSIIHTQFMVSQQAIRQEKLDAYFSEIDFAKQIESSHDRFVKGSRVESLRR